MKHKTKHKEKSKITEKIYLRMTPEEKEWLIQFHKTLQDEAKELGTAVPSLNRLIRALIIKQITSGKPVLRAVK